ncbi:hypothetical protein VWY34_06635 [Phaeobacter sp. JH20_02]|uniref:hypothetical protein n=1 Tax=unclassified Phaeobacter TaxID=2621772 RepID=UPI003A852373
MGNTATNLVFGILGALVVYAVLHLAGLQMWIIAPAMFWFITIPVIVAVAFVGHSTSQPALKRVLSSIAVATGSLFAASGFLLLALAMRDI